MDGYVLSNVEMRLSVYNEIRHAVKENHLIIAEAYGKYVHLLQQTGYMMW